MKSHKKSLECFLPATADEHSQKPWGLCDTVTKCYEMSTSKRNTILNWRYVFSQAKTSTDICFMNKFDWYHWVKVLPKWRKLMDFDQHLISSKGGLDISVCQMSHHSFHAFSWKDMGTQNLTHFRKLFGQWDLVILHLTLPLLKIMTTAGLDLKLCPTVQDR